MVNDNKMVMPSNYVDMDSDEMEYDGGFNIGRAVEWVGAAVAFASGVALMCKGVGVGGAPLIIGMGMFLVGGKVSGDLSWSESENDPGC